MFEPLLPFEQVDDQSALEQSTVVSRQSSVDSRQSSVEQSTVEPSAVVNHQSPIAKSAVGSQQSTIEEPTGDCRLTTDDWRLPDAAARRFATDPAENVVLEASA